MPLFSTPAILLRRLDYGDFDLILTFLSLERGKISLIAKSAKKSTKRFAGILELFTLMEAVASAGKGRGLPVLQEATLISPFSTIRNDIRKTAYASYWVELVDGWMEPGQPNPALFDLLLHVLTRLDAEDGTAAALSVLFQARFMTLAGLAPNLRRCGRCHLDLDRVAENRVDVVTEQAVGVASDEMDGRQFAAAGGGSGCPRSRRCCRNRACPSPPHPPPGSTSSVPVRATRSC